jgi:hypothetical protein
MTVCVRVCAYPRTSHTARTHTDERPDGASVCVCAYATRSTMNRTLPYAQFPGAPGQPKSRVQLLMGTYSKALKRGCGLGSGL